jgi:cephalosporin-C deacetylase-like acetyl esterase
MFSIASLALAFTVSVGSGVATAEDVRVRELEWLRKELPPLKFFDQWLAETGELPPDFSKLEAHPTPQSLVTVTRNGQPHRLTVEEWPAQRAVLRDRLEEWLLGKAPPAPGNVQATVESKTSEPTHEVWTVQLTFGPDHGAKLPCWLWIPKAPKTKRLPVFISDAERTGRFAMAAMEEGRFAICIYGASDRNDASKDYKDLFGKFSWCDLRRRAWSASRAVDWLTTLDFVDSSNLYIGGHSRSGKVSLIAAAFDDRIAGVIGSSPGGGGGSMNSCFSDLYYLNASAEVLSRGFPTWRSPRLRFFTGRENQLQADNDMIYALVAPRPLMMSTALHDPVENTWAIEQFFEHVREVYELLGHPENMGQRYRPGPHAPDPDTYLAHSRFLVQASERKSIAEAFPYRPYHLWNYDAWAAKQLASKAPEPLSSTASRVEIADRIKWLLGEAPDQSAPAPQTKLSAKANSPARATFGNGLLADVHYPEASDSGGKLPAVLWLGPFSTATGYGTTFTATGDAPQDVFTKAGFVMMGYDPIGTRDRHDERRSFYEDHPRWSLMGKMVQDARDALTALAVSPHVDQKRIYVVGYGMGGMTTSFLMALDDRPAGAAIIAGFTPFRTDTDARGTGGIRRWSHLYGWIPRLGRFVGHEDRVPVDFDQILVAAAPRPMLVMAPARDWHSTHADIQSAVEAAQKQSGQYGDQFTLLSPDRWIEFNRSMQSQVSNWLKMRATEVRR